MGKEMRDVAIISACRTPIGKHGGTLLPVSAVDLAAVAVKEALNRSGLGSSVIDLVILGHCRQSSDDPNIARLAALKAGIPEKTPAFTVMNQCASGMTSIFDGVMNIALGQYDTVLCGGTESMSNAIFYFRKGRYGLGTGNTELLDSLVEAQLRSQPQDLYGIFNMGLTAENIAEKYEISREEQDEFAFRSQEKALAAISYGKFKDEIVPVSITQRKGAPILFHTDEYPRKTSIEALAKLKPVFRTDGRGSVTAGNASGRNDGAAALILTTVERAKALGIPPLGVIRGFDMAGIDPRYMGMGPVPATEKALKRAGLEARDIGLVELNEAFAAQSIGCLRKMKFASDIVNVNGGAIALGHPLGCTGARITVTLLHEMQKRGTKYGLATLCVAGGLGAALVIENFNC